MNQRQCCPADEPERDAGQRAVFLEEGQADFRRPSFRRPWGSATLNIQRLEEMAAQRSTWTGARRQADVSPNPAGCGRRVISAMNWSSIRPTSHGLSSRWEPQPEYACDSLPGVEEQVLRCEGIAAQVSAPHGIRAFGGAGNLPHHRP